MIENIEAVEPTPYMRQRMVCEKGFSIVCDSMTSMVAQFLKLGVSARVCVSACAPDHRVFEFPKYHDGGTVDPQYIALIQHCNEMHISTEMFNRLTRPKPRNNFTFHLTDWFRRGIKFVKHSFNL